MASAGIAPARKPSPLLCYFTVGTCNIKEFIFDTHLKTGKQTYGSNQETKQMSCWNPTEYIFSLRLCGLRYQMPFVNWQEPFFFDHLPHTLLGVSGYD